MRHVYAKAALVCLMGLAVCSLAKADDASGRNAEALQRSLDMLHVEMKLRVLQEFYSRAGMYMPKHWVVEYQEQHRKLAEEMNDTSVRIAGLEDWVAESQKARANEVLETYKLAEDGIGKLLKADKWLTERKKAGEDFKRMMAKKNGSLEVARYVEEFTGRIHRMSKGPEDDALLAAFSMRWEQRAREVYKGALGDTDTLVKSIAALEKQRLEVEARLEFLKEVESGLELAKAAQDPAGRCWRRPRKRRGRR
jgi:hypothetical protein